MFDEGVNLDCSHEGKKEQDEGEETRVKSEATGQGPDLPTLL